MNQGLLVWLSIGGGIAACASAAAARSLHEFSRSDLEEIARRGGRSGRFSDILRHHNQIALSFEMAAALAAALFVLAGAAWAWQRPDGAPLSAGRLAVLTAGFGLALSILMVWLPWLVARLFAARMLYHTWPVLRFVSRLVAPFVWVAHISDTILRRLVGHRPVRADEESLEEEIRTIVSEGHREGLLEEDAREMIEGVIELGDAVVSQIMTPRTDMHMVPVDLPWNELLDDVIHSGHTRIPVYGENRDDIVGILYSKDLLPELAKTHPEERKGFAALLRKPVFVPETKAVDELLEMFQQVRTHIALVLDEYGGVCGLVTIEDVLEEIVGDIVDEYDPDEEDEIQVLDDGTCEALGSAHVDEINAKMGLQLPEDEDFDTIAGFVFTEFGRVPQAGEQFVWQEELQVTVLEASRRRINRVRLQRLNEASREIA